MIGFIYTLCLDYRNCQLIFQEFFFVKLAWRVYLIIAASQPLYVFCVAKREKLDEKSQPKIWLKEENFPVENSFQTETGQLFHASWFSNANTVENYVAPIFKPVIPQCIKCL